MSYGLSKVLLGALASASAYAVAAAQTAPTEPAAQAEAAPSAAVGEIVVTAQRREQTANSVPMSIDAFTGAQLQEKRVTAIEDLTSVTPALKIAPNPGGVPNYYLRGVGFNTSNQSGTSPVGTYVDEVAYPYPVMNEGPVFDLDRVEVLKGPQGTLFGRNTTAGLIDFVTGKPTKDLQGYFTAEGGNYATHNFEGMISGPLADKVQARVAFRTEDSDDGWQKSMSRDETLGQVHKYGVRGSITAEPTDRLKVEASYNMWINKSDTQAGQMVAFAPTTAPGSAFGAFNDPALVSYFATHKPSSAADADWDPVSARSAATGTPGTAGYGAAIQGPNAEDSMFNALKLKLDEDLGGGTHVISLTGYDHLERKSVSDFSGAPYELQIYQDNGRFSSFNQEFRLEGRNPRVNWMIGGYVGHDTVYDSTILQQGDNAVVYAIRAAATGLLSAPINTFGYTEANIVNSFRAYRDAGSFDATTWSVFANADWTLLPKLSLTTGLRYTEDMQHYKGCTSDYDGSLVPIINLFNRTNWASLASSHGVAPAPIGFNQCNEYLETENRFGYYISNVNEDNVAFRAALNWHMRPGVIGYISISQGAKNASIPVNAATIAEQNVPAKQELLLAYEIGVKARLFGDKVQANGALFYYDYRNKQLVGNFSDPIYTVLTQLQNVPKSEADGFDGDLTWRILPPLSLGVSATYLHTQVLSYPGAIGDDGQPTNLDGSAFPYSPTFSSTLSVLLDQPLTARLRLNGDFDMQYQTKSNATLQDDPLYAIPSYAIFNANIGLASREDGWKAMLWVKNLTDKYYWNQIIDNSNAVVRYAGHTRTFGATVTKSF